MSDLRTLATGFRELSVRAATPEPPPAPVVAPAPVRVRKEIYSAPEPGLILPVTLNQVLPPFPLGNGMATGGLLEVVIDQTGVVESATMRSSVNPRYDMNVLNATKNWKYQPALMDGTPVKFRKLITIALKAQD